MNTPDTHSKSYILVGHSEGLHMRPLSAIVDITKKYEQEIRILLHNPKNGITVNARSILDLLTLNAPYGTELELITEKAPDETHLAILEDIRLATMHHALAIAL